MRRLKLQMQMTLDGFIAGPHGEMDWMNLQWSDDLKDYVTRLTDPVDTIILGKNLAQGFIPHWTEGLNQSEPLEGAKKMVETPKVVFSKTLTNPGWERTYIASGDLVEEINTLKQKEGGDMIVYGGGRLVASMIKENLIDEFHLFINPAAIGKGMPIFQELTEKQNYILISSKSFDCGVIVLIYIPV